MKEKKITSFFDVGGHILEDPLYIRAKNDKQQVTQQISKL